MLIGCGGCLGLIVLSVIGSVGIFLFTMSLIKKSEVFEDAFQRVQNSAEVQQALGTPITTGWSFSGSVNYKNGSGTADFSAPVIGPKGEGTMVVKANKSSGAAWQYSTMEVEFPGGNKVDLSGSP